MKHISAPAIMLATLSILVGIGYLYIGYTEVGDYNTIGLPSLIGAIVFCFIAYVIIKVDEADD